MNRLEATELLKQYTLTDAEREELLKTTLTVSAAQPDFQVRILDPDRAKFFAAVWYLGASYRNIALLYNVKHPTIVQAVRRYIPAHAERAAYEMKPEFISEFRVQYYKHLEVVRPMDVKQVAAWLLETTQLDTDNAK